MAQQSPYDKGAKKSGETENYTLVLVFVKVCQINLYSGQKHDVEQSHVAEYLKTAIPLQQVQSVWPYQYSGQQHAHNVGDVQPVEQDGSKQDDAEYEEEYPRWVRYGKD